MGPGASPITRRPFDDDGDAKSLSRFTPMCSPSARIAQERALMLDGERQGRFASDAGAHVERLAQKG
jgi:hypothetical protein